MLLLVEEAIGWIEARTWRGEPSLGPQRVELRVGQPLPVRPRLEHYRTNRRQALKLLMADLEQSLQAVLPDSSL